MNYEKETLDLYNSLRERYLVQELIEISKRLFSLSISCYMFKDRYEFDELEKDEIFKSCMEAIPENIKTYLKFYHKLRLE